ncbi:uncharacterized protein [Rutidosis leptorrhynchoides]|uniref:uncharacterized protein n=1 Tax=Rutidosis leptorrhynchoides TaxID=125765 RepID=UPI003A99AC08
MGNVLPGMLQMVSEPVKATTDLQQSRDVDCVLQSMECLINGPSMMSYLDKSESSQCPASILAVELKPTPKLMVGRHLVGIDSAVSLQPRANDGGQTSRCTITAALRQLAYSYTPDALDEYLQRVIQRATLHDIQRFYEGHERIHGFSGMLGSIDCMHPAWEKCPISWRGNICEAITVTQLLCLKSSPSMIIGFGMRILVLRYRRGYYLSDDIYPTWIAFIKGFSSAVDEKRSYFTRKQAGAHKDVERTFGILQGCWHILQQPTRAYEVNLMRQLMYTCIVIHNIIIKDNGYNLAENDWVVESVQHIQRTWIERCDARARRTRELRDRGVNEGLRSDLVEHF